MTIFHCCEGKSIEAVKAEIQIILSYQIIPMLAWGNILLRYKEPVRNPKTVTDYIKSFTSNMNDIQFCEALTL